MYISKRGTKLLENHQPLVNAHFRCAQDPWAINANPEGYINLGTAENHLVFDILKTKLNVSPGFDEEHTHYAELHGMKCFRDKLAGFLTNTTLHTITADKLVVASGSSAIIDMLIFAMCEPGEGIIIPAPYYAGFDHDLKTRVNVEPIPAYTDAENGFEITQDVLQQALLQAGKRTIKVRGILITNPNNPLGSVYSDSTLKMIIAFAKENKLSIISDELYARSVYGKRNYTSLARLTEEAGVGIHLVYGFAKDFGLSGFKVGVLYSTDSKILQVVQQLAYFMPVSNATQKILCNVLQDEAFLNYYFAENRKRLYAASVHIHKKLNQAEIDTHPTEAGFFIWLNLGKWLSAQTFEAEMELYNYILDKAKVNISPGQVFHSADPGWFRLCYAREPEMINEAVNRLSAVLGELEQVAV